MICGGLRLPDKWLRTGSVGVHAYARGRLCTGVVPCHTADSRKACVSLEDDVAYDHSQLHTTSCWQARVHCLGMYAKGHNFNSTAKQVAKF